MASLEVVRRRTATTARLRCSSCGHSQSKRLGTKVQHADLMVAFIDLGWRIDQERWALDCPWCAQRRMEDLIDAIAPRGCVTYMLARS